MSVALGSGMFGQSQSTLLTGLQKLGDRICQYGPIGVWPRRCDCKYGASLYGEESGCPEVAMAANLINVMSPAEFKRLAKRAKVMLYD